MSFGEKFRAFVAGVGMLASVEKGVAQEPKKTDGGYEKNKVVNVEGLKEDKDELALEGQEEPATPDVDSTSSTVTPGYMNFSGRDRDAEQSQKIEAARKAVEEASYQKNVEALESNTGIKIASFIETTRRKLIEKFGNSEKALATIDSNLKRLETELKMLSSDEKKMTEHGKGFWKANQLK